MRSEAFYIAWAKPGSAENTNLAATYKAGLDAVIIDPRTPKQVLTFMLLGRRCALHVSTLNFEL